MDDKPRWTRRKDERPSEIAEAALGLFIDRGFAATKLSDVAARAGVAKGTLYRYFDTKEELFRAVVRRNLSTNLAVMESAAATSDVVLADALPAMLVTVAGRMSDGRMPAMLRMVIAESLTFPDLATIWHDEVVAKALALVTGMIRAAQARGEIRPGDADLFAFALVGPLVAAILFREVFGTVSSSVPDVRALAEQHIETTLQGWRGSPK